MEILKFFKTPSFKNYYLVFLDYLYPIVALFGALFLLWFIWNSQLAEVENSVISVEAATDENLAMEVEEAGLASEVEVIEKICVDISGAVVSPGMYCFNGEGAARVDDLLENAGGYLELSFARSYVERQVNLSSYLYDQQKVYIPFENEYVCQELMFETVEEEVLSEVPTGKDVPEESANNNGEENGEQCEEGGSGEGVSGCIDLNEATSAELEELNGVGPSTASKIINGRPYTTNLDLLNVSGIGQATYDKLEGQLCEG